jgi:hypothetical protein
MPYDLHRVLNMPTCKDVPCNTEVMFLPRGNVLDMTVINRSNDLIWGALGSNYVTFSMLHEYVALATGFEIGVYNQITNNLHVYTSQVEAQRNDESQTSEAHELWSGKFDPVKLIELSEFARRYEDIPAIPFWNTDGGIYHNLISFNEDLAELFEDINLATYDRWLWNTDFFDHIVSPMLLCWNAHKRRDYDMAFRHANNIAARDWQVACREWIARRAEKHTGRTAAVAG